MGVWCSSLEFCTKRKRLVIRRENVVDLFSWAVNEQRARAETAFLTWLYQIAIIQRMKVSVADAKNKLPELIKAAEDGETVTICRRGVPAVDIVRTKKPSRKKRRLGTLKGKIQVLEPEWWKPMSDDEVEAFVEGRD